MIAFEAKGGALFTYRVDFAEHDYANISFFDRDLTSIPLHLSLRAKPQLRLVDRLRNRLLLRPHGRAVFNHRIGRDWQSETPLPVLFRNGEKRDENRVEIAFSAAEVSVSLNGRELLRQACDSARITGFDYQGGVLPQSIELGGARFGGPFAQPAPSSPAPSNPAPSNPAQPGPAQPGPAPPGPAPPGPKPLISVIVPVYNVEDQIGACLRSLMAQELTDFEVLVILDGPRDASRAAAEAAVAGDPRFRLLCFDNGGLSLARNRGLDLARGDFIAFVDGDDRVEPQYLSQMHAALQADGGDWVACGLRFISPDFTRPDYSGSHYRGPALSALHGSPPQDPDTPPQRHRFDDWTEVIRHYPSAWNKLYRRSLIGDLRFDVGTYYEDHAFFWQLACRTPYLLRLAAPLYLQTQGRDGQITRDGSDRVFEQFAVLDRLAGIMASQPARAGGPLAFARISSRLFYERSLALRDSARRARFAAAATAFMARHQIAWTPDWDPGIGRSFGLTLAGRLSLTVILASDGTTEPLRHSLAALTHSGWWDFEVLLIAATPDPAAQGRLVAARQEVAGQLPNIRLLPAADNLAADNLAAARNQGLAAAQGEWLLILTPGDAPHPQALEQGIEALLRQNSADLGLFRTQAGGAQAGGTPQGDLHAPLSAVLFRRSLVQDRHLTFAAHPLQAAQFLLQAALLGQGLRVLGAGGVTLAPSHTAPAPKDAQAELLARTAEAAARSGRLLPQDWQATLCPRLTNTAPPIAPEFLAILSPPVADAAKQGF